MTFASLWIPVDLHSGSSDVCSATRALFSMRMRRQNNPHSSALVCPPRFLRFRERSVPFARFREISRDRELAIGISGRDQGAGAAVKRRSKLKSKPRIIRTAVRLDGERAILEIKSSHICNWLPGTSLSLHYSAPRRPPPFRPHREHGRTGVGAIRLSSSVLIAARPNPQPLPASPRDRRSTLLAAGRGRKSNRCTPPSHPRLGWRASCAFAWHASHEGVDKFPRGTLRALYRGARRGYVIVLVVLDIQRHVI